MFVWCYCYWTTFIQTLNVIINNRLSGITIKYYWNTNILHEIKNCDCHLLKGIKNKNKILKYKSISLMLIPYNL